MSISNKMWYIYVIELLSSDKKGSNSEHASTWTNYEDIRLSEISHKRHILLWFYLCEVPRVVKLIQTESWMKIAMGLME